MSKATENDNKIKVLETPILGGHFRSKKFRRKNRNIFPKKGGEGGGQRPFGTFPKIHRYWFGQASLSCIVFNAFADELRNLWHLHELCC